jgi:predicted nucleotidyltransferase
MPSDADPAPFDPRPFADGLRRMNAAERERTAERARSAVAEAEHLADRIATTVPGIRRIYLFGSLLGGVPRNPDFDIDLAVEGDVYGAMEACESSDWRVDVIDLEGATPAVARRIRETGRQLYPRKEAIHEGRI